MKKIFLPFIFICSLSTSFSQGLEFNRSIDTLLIGNTISSGAQINWPDYSLTFDLLNDSLSPPNGKVWKIQSIILSTNKNPSTQGSYVYSNGNNYGSFHSSVVILKNNELVLVKQYLPNIYNSSYYVSNLPIWINSNSNLMLGLRHESSDQPLYMNGNYSGIMVWFSILEFNEN